MKKMLSSEIVIFLLALQFLTRMPIPQNTDYSLARQTAAARYYPLVGLLVGAISAGVFYVASLALPVVLGVLLATAAGLLLTGAFHEDGLADTFDGIGGGGSRERTLEIMRDSRIGAYGGAALVLALAIKVAALAILEPRIIIIGLTAAHGLSRLSSVIVIATSCYARSDGAGKPTADGISAPGLIVAAITGAVCLAGLAYWLTPAAALWAAAGLVAGHVAMRAFFERKLGGYTGDALGAVQQASEIGVYLGLVAWA